MKISCGCYPEGDEVVVEAIDQDGPFYLAIGTLHEQTGRVLLTSGTAGYSLTIACALAIAGVLQEAAQRSAVETSRR